MLSRSRERRTWSLHQDAFDRLLSCLHQDREQAALEYEKIRGKLTKLFQWNGCVPPEDYVDETFDRVARRITEDPGLQLESPYNYFHGVARNVLRERWKPGPRIIPLDELPPGVLAAPDPEEQLGREAQWVQDECKGRCVNECLSALEPGDEDLVRSYYLYNSGHIERRRSLAEAMKISPNALRIRVSRLLKRLESCIRSCLEQATG
jgi:DNA-directed RNA polymerase specialized sigma24 family protein